MKSILDWWQLYLRPPNAQTQFRPVVSNHEIEYLGALPAIGPGYFYHCALYRLTPEQTLALLAEGSPMRSGGEIPQWNVSCTYRPLGERNQVSSLFSLLLCTERITGDSWKTRVARKITQILIRDLKSQGAAAKGHLFRCDRQGVRDRWCLPDDEIDAFWVREAQIGYESAMREYREFQ